MVQRLDRSLRPIGKRLWDVHGLGNWLDTACTDPDDENTVYTKENVFKMDWTKPQARSSRWPGSRSIGSNTRAIPASPKVMALRTALINGIRRIEGKPFLFCGGQGTGSLEIYKFGKGYVAAPCGYVGGAYDLAAGCRKAVAGRRREFHLDGQQQRRRRRPG